MECIKQNGDITGYSVWCGVEGSGTTFNVSVVGRNATEVTISELNSATTYFIQVAAVNSAGIGVYSIPVYVTTEGTKVTYFVLFENFWWIIFFLNSFKIYGIFVFHLYPSYFDHFL